MIKNYLKIAWRNLIRNKGFSITNILGLTIGMTCTIFIFLWVKNELAYDKFHQDNDNIYQVMATRDFKNNIFTDPSMVLPLAKVIRRGQPIVEKTVVTTYQESHLVQYGETKLKKDLYQVSDQFFNIFSWKFIKGNAATAINDPKSIVITESAAKVIFW
jgi:putative ABC transport system permease protein